jgi:hypothetical protein
MVSKSDCSLFTLHVIQLTAVVYRNDILYIVCGRCGIALRRNTRGNSDIENRACLDCAVLDILVGKRFRHCSQG